MSYMAVNQYAKWFGRVIWLGILANFALALPTLFLPDEMLAMMSLPSASPSMWPSFAALLLILLSLFYIPAAKPLQYRPVALLSVLARLAWRYVLLRVPSGLFPVRRL